MTHSLTRRRQAGLTQALLEGPDLERRLDPEAASELGESAHAHADALVQARVEHLRGRSALACTVGCKWCCHVEVSATMPELARLSAHIRAMFAPEDLAALVQRLGARHEARSRLDERARATTSRACALLVDDRCSAYEARPLRCRGWNSADVEPCRIAWAEPEAPPSVPVHALLRQAALDVGDGLADGLREAGLDETALDLTAGLLALLRDDGTLVARWVEGAMLPRDLVSEPEPAREQGPDGRWRIPAG